ncbi:Glucose-6-phosphate isomerase cytosolic [Bienertia sinuspersici]
MGDADRCKSMMVEFDGLLLDYSRQNATVDTMNKLLQLAEAAHLKEKINKMFNGEHINSTENRSVLHFALRASRDAVINSDGKNVVPDVWQVLDKIRDFSEKIRSGSWAGVTGKPLTDVVAIGIGGSFLGPLFVHTALQTEPEASECARGRQLRLSPELLLGEKNIQRLLICGHLVALWLNFYQRSLSLMANQSLISLTRRDDRVFVPDWGCLTNIYDREKDTQCNNTSKGKHLIKTATG